ncbi:MAG: lysylphosphatidylglycerol synthase transmembrane domain-containing protein [Bacillota bacterium]|nr:lysylphosphatidylglycerol synthase transmembrane domain-containing protein [Bacillota bacterium]
MAEEFGTDTSLVRARRKDALQVPPRLNLGSLRRGLLFSLAISLAALGFLFTRRGLHLPPSADPRFIFLAFAAMFLAWLAEACRLQMMSSLLGGRLSFSAALRIVLASTFAAAVTPLSSGQGPLQIYLLHRRGQLSWGSATALFSVRTAFTSLLFSGTVPLLILYLGSGPWLPPVFLPPLLLASSAIAGFTVLFLALAGKPQLLRSLLLRTARTRHLPRPWRRRLLRRLAQEAQAFQLALPCLLRAPLGLLGQILALTALYWALYFLAAPFLWHALGVRLPWGQALAFQAVFNFALSHLPLPGGSGIAELGLSSAFSRWAGADLAALFALLWRLVSYYFGLAAGGVALLWEMALEGKK